MWRTTPKTLPAKSLSAVPRRRLAVALTRAERGRKRASRNHKTVLTARVARFYRPIVFLCIIPLALTACGGGAPVITATQADPAVVAKINYVCAYSGLFKFADTLATSVIPVPGAAMVGSLVNAGVDKICANPTAAAADEATVVALIAKFKAAGRM